MVCLPYISGYAQTTDFGAIVGAGYSGKIVKGFGYSLEGEVKTWGNFKKFNRLKKSRRDLSLRRGGVYGCDQKWMPSPGLHLHLR